MSFILTSIAGLSTLLGSLIIFIKPKNIDKLIHISLSFAAGVMLTVSLIDLIPESFHLCNGNLLIKLLHFLISMNIGIIISIYLEILCQNC